ncbi:MAG: hypothetical protein GY845_09930 [Planctomycetes bacterium]|nr:hypothetical protein [Planctomycetota bacterium]
MNNSRIIAFCTDRYQGCKYAYIPKSREDFWNEQFRKNVERHKQVTSVLEDLGWNVIVIWECELLETETIQRKLSEFFHNWGNPFVCSWNI